jgi:hypothetical protein
MVFDDDGSNIRPSEFQRYLQALKRQLEEGILRSVGIPEEYIQERESDQVDAMRYAWGNLHPDYLGYYSPSPSPNIIEGRARVIQKPILLLGTGKIEAEEPNNEG